jgi:tRNA-2-methylthio-N6-dimethylallyladenosine synthase
MSLKQKTYYIHTFGCQSNKSDSERIAGDYEARGYSEAKTWQECDELVINTCAIRKRAEDKVLGLVQNILKHFRDVDKPRPKLILTGCMTHHANERLYELLPDIDEILPINEVGFNQAAIRKDKKHAWIPISVGCNSYCTYCIVPYSRGREKSRSEEDIMNEVQRLVDNGYDEVTLLGMNVNSWGLEKVGVPMRKMMMEDDNFTREDLPDNQTQYLTSTDTPPFVRLLQKITKFDQIKKIRFMSSNPWDFHDELIDEVGKNKKIDRYVHLPIQSGSNSVLYRMNRGYTVEKYKAVVDKLKALDPEIVIGTDIIVGFPGETNEEFNETVELAKKIGWKVGFVAIYSPRPGTASWRLYKDEEIPHKIKKKRWEILDKIINKDNMSDRPKVI